MRRYQGFVADSARWERFSLRPGDIVISTPSKSGTTWMQTIVGMLTLGRVDLGEPLTRVSPWLDMLIHPEDEIFDLLESQRHRRFIKTHTPLDGLPDSPAVTFITVTRHPLDVALSNLDHAANLDVERLREMRHSVAGEPDPEMMAKYGDPPTEPAAYLRWFIDNHVEPTGSGPYSLSDYCQQVGIAWERRHRPNVHLFHYQDLWDDLGGEMRRVALALDVEVDGELWPDLVDAATLDSMRSRATQAAPDAHTGLWRSDEGFFKAGGTREWRSLLDDSELDHFHARLRDLAGDAADWMLKGRVALHSDGDSNVG
jgi:aryl sulfotransferase